jgi:branched-chain amino acid transport system permease protein
MNGAASQSASRPDVITALRRTALTGVLAFALLLPLIGFNTVVNIRNELVLETRWPLLFAMAATIAGFRFLQLLWIGPWFATLSRPGALELPADVRGLLARWGQPAVLGFVIIYPVLALVLAGPGAGKFIDNFGVQILIYVLLAWGLNIVVGLAGLLDLGYVSFYAIGAYTVALVGKTFGLSFWMVLPLAGILAAFWGILVGFPVLRLRGDYLAVVTLAFAEIIRLVLVNWVPVTGGYAGISGLPRPTLFGIPFTAGPEGFAARFGLEVSPLHRLLFLYYILIAAVVLAGLVISRLRRLPIGRAWEALREDEIACRSLGINTITSKLTAFAMGAFFGGLAGAFFTARQGFISPESVNFGESAQILAIVVLGGMGSQAGIAIAAVVIIGGTELLRELDFLKLVFGPEFDPTQYRMLLFGFMMVVIIVWKPRGLVGTREPSLFLGDGKAGGASEERK